MLPTKLSDDDGLFVLCETVLFTGNKLPNPSSFIIGVPDEFKSVYLKLPDLILSP